jgi:hypothetical protein
LTERLHHLTDAKKSGVGQDRLTRHAGIRPMLKFICRSFLLASLASASQAQPIVGIDSAQSAQYLKDSCKQPGCISTSIVAIPSRVGNASACVQPSLDNVSLAMTMPRLYYVYRYKNGCSFTVYANVKVSNAWHQAGDIQPGGDVTVSLMYSSDDGSPPTTIMLCKGPGGAKDDLSCQP